MARAIWSGVLTFGLVSVPVEPDGPERGAASQRGSRQEGGQTAGP